MASDRWILTGRDEELRYSLEVLDDDARRGLVLSGPAGIGKSRLAAEVLACVPDDRAVVRIIATHSSIPFAPFAHLFDAPADGGRLEPPDLLWALRRLRAAVVERAAGAPLVLAVDDAHLLDEASATLVRQVGASGDARLLLTVRSGSPCPDAIASLWRDDSCALLELQALSHHEVGELTAHLFGRWFERASLDRLFAASAGNPLVLRELLADAEAGDGLSEHRGLLRWRGVGASARLAALVEADLGRLSEPGRAFVDVLAVGEPVPTVVARSLAGLEVLAELERAGVVTVDQLGDDQVRLDHPLFGEVRKAQLGPLQITAIERALAEAFTEHGPPGRDGHELRVVCWRLAGGEVVPAATLLDAAHEARARGDADLAERLARAALDQGPLPSAELLLAELAEVGGRPQDAAALLDGLAERLEGDDERARALTTQIRVLAIVLGQVDAAAHAAMGADRMRDPVWQGFVRAQWATTLAMLGRLDEAGALSAALFTHPDERVRLRVLPAVNLTAYAAGRLHEALAAAQSMVGPALAWRDQVPVGISVVFSALALDLRSLGRLDELDELLALVDDPVATLPSSRAYLLLVEGSSALQRGLVAEARRLLSESVELFSGTDPQGYRAAATALLSQACAHGGDAPAAAAAAHEALAAIESRPRRLIDVDSRRACAWATAAAGDLATARRELTSVADAARTEGIAVLELEALHDAVRLGAGRTTQRRLRSVAARVDGPRSAAMGAHAEAVLADDVAAFEGAGEAFAAVGEHLVAAELLGAAARHYAAVGRRDGARRTGARARALLARCEGATTSTGLPAAGPRLTPREQQVARLAAEGRSSKEIAAELAVSVRTVDNQLSRAYTKLGIGGRSELADALADHLGAAG